MFGARARHRAAQTLGRGAPRDRSSRSLGRPPDGHVITERSYPGEAASVPKARRFIASALSALPALAADVQESVMLMVSELATNAVRHTGQRFTVCIDVGEDSV